MFPPAWQNTKWSLSQWFRHSCPWQTPQEPNMPNAPEPKRPNSEDTLGLILAAIIGFVLFTLLGKLIRRPILLAVVVASLFGFYWYGQHLLQRDLQHVTIQTVGTGRDCGDLGSIAVRITNNDTRGISAFRFRAKAFQANHTDSVGHVSERSDRIVPARTSHTQCWNVVGLSDLTDQQILALRWTAEITSISFAE
jgi:hypothetical protein